MPRALAIVSKSSKGLDADGIVGDADEESG
jgi:hypothetical protein